MFPPASHDSPSNAELSYHPMTNLPSPSHLAHLHIAWHAYPIMSRQVTDESSGRLDTIRAGTPADERNYSVDGASATPHALAMSVTTVARLAGYLVLTSEYGFSRRLMLSRHESWMVPP